MQIRIHEVPMGSIKPYEGEEEPTILGLPTNDPLVKTDHPLQYRLEVTRIPGRIVVRGEVWTKALFLCSRCGESFREEVRDETFERVIETPRDVLSVDLTEDIREAIVLSFPGYPLCRRECQGLCPRCGTNLNRRRCRCGPPPKDGPWSALESLIGPK